MPAIEVSASDAANIMLDAIRRWQRARRAIFAYPMKPNPDAEQLALWRELGDAEHALMDI
jgi:hypothetical protein